MKMVKFLFVLPTTNKQIFICFKKCYTITGDTVYAALYIRYLGFLK